MASKNVGCALRVFAEQPQQPLARRAQPLRKHQDQLHQDLGAEQRLLDDDARQALAVEHGDQRRLYRDAGGEARLAVEHRHLAERPPPSTTASVCCVFQRSRFCTSTLPSTTISMKSPPSPSWMISAPGSARYISMKCVSRSTSAGEKFSSSAQRGMSACIWLA